MPTRRDSSTPRMLAAPQLDLNGFAKPPPWMARALCASVDPQLFFPDHGWSPKQAKALCAQCPVATACLDYALAFESGDTKVPDRQGGYGIYGGLTAGERKALRRSQREAS